MITALQHSGEGNVFSRACVSTGGGGSHVTITHDALGLTIHTPSPDMFRLIKLGLHCTGTLPWNMFNLELTVQGHPPSPLYQDPLLGPGLPPLPRYVQTCSLRTMYDWQVGGWHPTGMLS